VSFIKAPLAAPRRATNISTLVLAPAAIAVAGCGSFEKQQLDHARGTGAVHGQLPPHHRRRPAPHSSRSRPARRVSSSRTEHAEREAGTVSIDFSNSSSVEHNFTLANSLGRAGRSHADVPGRQQNAHGEPQTGDLQVLLHRARAPRGGHGRHADAEVSGSARCAERHASALRRATWRAASSRRASMSWAPSDSR